MLRDVWTVALVALLACTGHVRTTINVYDNLLTALRMAKSNIENQKMLNEKLFRSGADMESSTGYGHVHMHNLFGSFRSSLQSQCDEAEVLIGATQILVQKFGGNIRSIVTNPLIIALWPQISSRFCAPRLPDCTPSKYRTTDGSCNNPNFPTWGMVGRGHKRFLPPHYQDGVSMPRKLSVTGSPLPSARLVSITIHRTSLRDQDLVERHDSVMVMHWGQLIDHDITDTPMLKGFNGAGITCCNLPKNTLNSRHACFPIHIPPGDPVFNSNCMNFVRSAPSSDDKCRLGLRQQMNQASSYLDAGFLYGTSEETSRILRAFQFGFMKMTSRGFYFPHEDQNNCMRERSGDYCMRSGDQRIHVVPGLTSVQVLMLREHNRIAAMLGKINPHWNDEIIYQETRKIVIALVQHITYGEYLERIIGPAMMSYLSLYITPHGFNTVYDPAVDATVANSVVAAALRFGHSMVPGTVNHVFQNTSRFEVPIENTFNRPSMVLSNRGQGNDHVTRWLFTDQSARNDRFIESGLHDLLFLDSQGNSMDLPALNIQRGRDHGIPGYNAWRTWCGLPTALTFNDLVEIDPDTRLLFANIYKHVDDIDLFPGGLSEMIVNGGSVGPTFACILGRQFKALKFGDRFWYENNFFDTGFTEAQLNTIKSQKLSTLICNNQPELSAPLDAFSIPSNMNPYVPCMVRPQIDLWLWQDVPHGNNILAVRAPFTFMTKVIHM